MYGEVAMRNSNTRVADPRQSDHTDGDGDRHVTRQLQEIAAAERGSIRMLRAHLAGASDDHERTSVTARLDQARSHLALIDLRLAELGAPTHHTRLGALRDRFADLSLSTRLRIGAVRSDGAAMRFAHAKDEAVIDGLEIAEYHALEHQAHAAGDTETAELATLIRADKRKMFNQLRHELPELAVELMRPDQGDPT